MTVIHDLNELVKKHNAAVRRYKELQDQCNQRCVSTKEGAETALEIISHMIEFQSEIIDYIRHSDNMRNSK